MSNKVSVSILSADLMHMEDDLQRIEQSGAEMLHFDVMDGVFVKNISFGQPLLKAVDKMTDMHLDVHLMIADPLKYVKRFADSGADLISFHIESDSDTLETIKAIKECGVKPALAIKPATPAESVFEYLPYLDMVLVMTVEPGFGGQSFITETVDKIRAVRQKITELGLDVNVEVDGGINGVTSGTVREAGANVLVSGSYLFAAENMAKAAQSLKEDMPC